MTPVPEPWWNLRHTAAWCGVAAVLVCTMCLGGVPPVFVDVPISGLVLGGGGLAWLAMVGRDWRALPSPWGPRPEGGPAPDHALAVLAAGRQATWMMAALGALVHLVLFFSDPAAVSTPEWRGTCLQIALLNLFYAVLVEIFVLSPVELPLRLQRHSVPAARPAARVPALSSLRAALLALVGVCLPWLDLFGVIDPGVPLGPALILVPAGAGCLWLVMVGRSRWTFRAALEGTPLSASALNHAEEVGRALRRAVWLMALATGLISAVHGLANQSIGAIWLALPALLTAILIDLFGLSAALTHVRARQRRAVDEELGVGRLHGSRRGRSAPAWSREPAASRQPR